MPSDDSKLSIKVDGTPVARDVQRYLYLKHQADSITEQLEGLRGDIEQGLDEIEPGWEKVKQVVVTIGNVERLAWTNGETTVFLGRLLAVERPDVAQTYKVKKPTRSMRVVED